MEDLAVNKLDPNHKFSYVGNEFGPIKLFWYQDRAENYWLYSNAPEGHPDHDLILGEPFFNSEQPTPSVTPEFFSPEGFKMNVSCPPEAQFTFNEAYNPKDRLNSWYGMYTSGEGQASYVYLDKDVRENLYLFVQQQIRLIDANLPKFRKFYAALFSSENKHDKIIGSCLLLMEQGFFSIEDITGLKVKDLDVKSDYIVLAGKRLSCDTAFFDFIVELTQGRDMEAYLFEEPTFFGEATPVTSYLLYSICAYLNVSPKFLPYSKASITFSQIVHKNLETGVSGESVEAMSDMELANNLFTSFKVSFYVNPQLRKTLLDKYQKGITKSFGNVKGDNTGLLHIDSTMYQMNSQELEYSQWLHSMPLHALSSDEVGL